jgi:hypothetical protein
MVTLTLVYLHCLGSLNAYVNYLVQNQEANSEMNPKLVNVMRL